MNLVFYSYLVLTSILGGNEVSSHWSFDKEYVTMYFEPTNFNTSTCVYTYTNRDSVVLQNVSTLNGILGYKVAWKDWAFFVGYTATDSTNTFLATTLAYNPITRTVAFDPGTLSFDIPDNSGNCTPQ